MADLKYIGKNILTHDLILKKGDVSGSLASTGAFGNLKISDNTRIKKGIVSIKHIINKGGKCIIISHLGRPSGKGYEKEYSLENILPSLSKELDYDIGFIKNYFSDDFNFDKLKSDVVLLENIRFY